MRLILSTLLLGILLSNSFASITSNETDSSLYFNEVEGMIVAEFESHEPASALAGSMVSINQKLKITDYSGSVLFYQLEPDTVHILAG